MRQGSRPPSLRQDGGRSSSALVDPGQARPADARPWVLRKPVPTRGCFTDLTAGEWRLLEAVESYCRHKAYCWPGNRELAGAVGKTPRTVQLLLKTLETKGFIRRVVSRGGERGGGHRTGIVLLRRFDLDLPVADPASVPDVVRLLKAALGARRPRAGGGPDPGPPRAQKIALSRAQEVAPGRAQFFAPEEGQTANHDELEKSSSSAEVPSSAGVLPPGGDDDELALALPEPGQAADIEPWPTGVAPGARRAEAPPQAPESPGLGEAVEAARKHFGDDAAAAVGRDAARIAGAIGGRWDCYTAAIARTARLKRAPDDLLSYFRRVALEYVEKGIPPAPVSGRAAREAAAAARAAAGRAERERARAAPALPATPDELDGARVWASGAGGPELARLGRMILAKAGEGAAAGAEETAPACHRPPDPPAAVAPGVSAPACPTLATEPGPCAAVAPGETAPAARDRPAGPVGGPTGCPYLPGPLFEVVKAVPTAAGMARGGDRPRPRSPAAEPPRGAVFRPRPAMTGAEKARHAQEQRAWADRVLGRRTPETPP